MNKSLYIAIAAVVLLALGTGGYFLLSNRSQTGNIAPNTQLTQNTQTETENTGAAPKTMKDLLSFQGTQQCTYSDVKGNGGTAYMSDGKMRGDMVSVSPQGNINSHMIVDGQTVYFWTEGQNTGMKMSVETMNSPTTQQNQTNIDINQELDMNCSSWVASSSVFTPPTTVTFSDLGKVTLPSGDSNSQCASCDSIPASAQAQCRAALCN